MNQKQVLPRSIAAFFAAWLVLWPAQTYADWRNDVGIFRVGFVVEGDRATHLARLEPFRIVLADELGIEVEFYPAADAMALINAFTSDRIEYAKLPTMAYALADVACKCVEPLVVPKAGDSTDGFHVVLLGRQGTTVSADAISGRRLAVLEQASISGHHWAINQLVSEGVIASVESVQLAKSTSPQQAVQMLVNGDVDALLGWSSLTGDPAEGYSRGTLRQIDRFIEADAGAFPILWKSSQVPHHPHVVRRKLNGEAKRLLRDTLLNMFDDDALAYDAIEPVLGGGFSATRRDRFLDLIRFVDQLYSASTAFESSANGEDQINEPSEEDSSLRN